MTPSRSGSSEMCARVTATPEALDTIERLREARGPRRAVLRRQAAVHPHVRDSRGRLAADASRHPGTAVHDAPDLASVVHQDEVRS
jgi:hypothetical protein